MIPLPQELTDDPVGLLWILWGHELIVNLYFGWTLIGWVVTLIWAASVDRDRL